jgi:hypothetical protein
LTQRGLGREGRWLCSRRAATDCACWTTTGCQGRKEYS